MEQDWTPPISRTDDVLATQVASASTSPIPAKWAPYSQTVQGIIALLVIAVFRTVFEYQMSEGDAAQVAEIVFMSASGIATWWTLEGRRKAQSLIYWAPRTKAERLETRVSLASNSLLGHAA